ncbi:MAG: sterol desaturase family protein [Acidobacteria bacterium]|nr:sterol desaturase family protein [Acidobacteriota bacterium]
MKPEDWWFALAAFAMFALFIVLEWGYWRWRGVRKFETKDALANYSLVAMQFSLSVLGKILFIVTVLDWIQQHGLRLAPDRWWAGVLLFLGVDLGYYWFHRLSHRVRFLWAIHESHHSSELMNLSVALRQPPLEPLVDWPFFSALAWVGFSAHAILTMYALNLTYQFFIHTEAINKLPRWLEAVFNTPSHHRVHHGTNPEYIDKNYAGVLIIWDRLFASFEPEVAPVRYGVLHPVRSHNPLFVGFHLWWDIARDVWRADSWSAKLKYVFFPPDWAESPTAQQVQGKS